MVEREFARRCVAREESAAAVGGIVDVHRRLDNSVVHGIYIRKRERSGSLLEYSMPFRAFDGDVVDFDKPRRRIYQKVGNGAFQDGRIGKRAFGSGRLGAGESAADFCGRRDNGSDA